MVAIAGPTALARTIDALRLQQGGPPDEIIAVGTQQSAMTAATDVKWIEEPGNVPRRRARGIRESTGDAVAIIEDTCVPAPGWSDALRTAHAQGATIAGGPVIAAPGLRATSVAAFLVEFGAYLPGASRGTHQLAGCNLSYAREILDRHADAWRDGLYETFFHERAARDGIAPKWTPGALVVFGRDETLSRAIRDRFHHGRVYGGLKHASRGPARLAHAAAAPLLVPLLAARLARAVARSSADRAPLWRALPATLPMLAGWSAGELAGTLFGPGDSIERWT